MTSFTSLCSLLHTIHVRGWKLWKLKLVFCCCSTSATRFKVLCIQRCFSAFLFLIFEALLPAVLFSHNDLFLQKSTGIPGELQLLKYSNLAPTPTQQLNSPQADLWCEHWLKLLICMCVTLHCCHMIDSLGNCYECLGIKGTVKHRSMSLFGPLALPD